MQELSSGRSIVVVDVRDVGQFRSEGGHLPGARSIPLAQLRARRSELEGLEPRRIVVVSNRGVRARAAALLLGVAGFREVSYLEGGMKRWHELGQPVERSSSAAFSV